MWSNSWIVLDITILLSRVTGHVHITQTLELGSVRAKQVGSSIGGETRKRASTRHI